MNWHFEWSWPITPTGYKQVKLTVVRVDVNDNGIFGHLTTDNGPFNCVTLENHQLCIPEGIYPVFLYDSPRFGYKVPMLKGVPGREAIEMHPGNKETDSHGCILVGTAREGNYITESKKAFNSLMEILKDCNDIQIHIK